MKFYFTKWHSVGVWQWHVTQLNLEKYPTIPSLRTAIFRRERSDDRKCICCSQAIQSPACSKQIYVISTISDAKGRNWKMCMLLSVRIIFFFIELFVGWTVPRTPRVATLVCLRGVRFDLTSSRFQHFHFICDLKQHGSSFSSNNFAPWWNCSLKMKYIQGLIPLLKHTRNQPRNRKFQEQAVFKPEKQAIIPIMNGQRQTISTATTVTSIANILRFICSRRCWFEGSWLPGTMVCLSLNPIAT